VSGLEDRAGLATFLVEHYWPGLTPGLFEAACGRVRLSADEIAGEGTPLRFLHSTLVAEEETAFCVFEAESAAAVEEAYARAAVPFERVVNALQIGIGADAHRLSHPIPAEPAFSRLTASRRRDLGRGVSEGNRR
jgi:hypothetical protein